MGEHKGNQYSELEVGKSYPLPEIRTSQEIADQTGTSEKTVRNNGKYAEDLLPMGNISEGAIREIAKVEPERRQEIFDKATEAAQASST